MSDFERRYAFSSEDWAARREKERAATPPACPHPMARLDVSVFDERVWCWQCQTWLTGESRARVLAEIDEMERAARENFRRVLLNIPPHLRDEIAARSSTTPSPADREDR